MKVRTTSGIGTRHLKPSGTGVRTDLEVLFLEKDGPCQASGFTTRGMLTGEDWGPVLDDGGHQLEYPLHPSAQVLLIHVSHVGGVSPCDGVMVLDLGTPPELEGVGLGPAPAQHLLSWHPLGTFAAGANGEGGGFLQKRKLRSERLMDLPNFCLP